MAAPVRIIGIDPGLRQTGWGIIECDGPRLSYLASGTVASDSTRALSERLLQLYQGLEQVYREWCPDEAAVELQQPFGRAAKRADHLASEVQC